MNARLIVLLRRGGTSVGVARAVVVFAVLPLAGLLGCRSTAPVIAAGSVAVVAVGVGAGLTVAANGKSQDARTLGVQVDGPSACSGSGATKGKCPALMNALVSQSTLSDGAFIAYLAGGVAAAGALGLGIWAAPAPMPTPPHDRSVQPFLRVLPTIGARDADIVVIGAW